MQTTYRQRTPSPTNTSRLKVKKLEYAVHEDPNLGLRQGMEDFTIVEPDLHGDGAFAFFCVLDGHGGQNVAKYIKDNYPKILKSRLETYKMAYSLPSILKMTIDNIENQIKMIGGRDMGSTFCGVLIDRQNARYFTINIGDSRALYARVVSMIKPELKFLTTEHKVSNPEEAERIKKTGGTVFNGRLAGNLLVSRSLGDFDFKKYGLSSSPDILEYDVGIHDVLIIASDGIWDTVGIEDIEKSIKENALANLDKFAKSTAELAVNKGSNDNISIIVIKMAN